MQKPSTIKQMPAPTQIPAAPAGQPVLEIRNLRTLFPSPNGAVTIVDDVSLSLVPGETLAIVGESGSGKTMTFLSALGLVPSPGKIDTGQVILAGKDLTALSPKELRKQRGPGLAMVFQDPLSSLNPVFTVGDQISEILRAHLPMSRKQARAKAIELLNRVHIPDPSKRVDDYPHQFSGGMRQRVLIAMAIALEPKVLICDEPTTALDVTVQAQILELLSSIQEHGGMAIALITHDLGLVARHADRMAVMYGGRVVEQGTVADVFAQPRHPYTVALLRSVPKLNDSPDIELEAIKGNPAMASDLPPGCAFEPRCFMAHARADCRTMKPKLFATDRPSHDSACHHWEELRHGATA